VWTFKTIGYLCESFIFAYLGITITLLSNDTTNLWLGVATIISTMFGRIFCMLFALGLLYLLDKKSMLDFRTLLMILYIGTLKGSICFAISILSKQGQYHLLRTTTMIVVLWTT